MTRHDLPSPTRLFTLRRAVALFALLSVAITWAWAHEGHQPLPTRGVAIDVAKGTVTLGPHALAALGAQVADVQLRALPDELAAPVTVVTPWQQHAYVSARLGGKVAALRVRPGQQVKQGQLVAEVESLELTDLQRELLDAQSETQLSEKTSEELEASYRMGSVPESAMERARTLHQQNLNALDVARRKLLLLGVPAAQVKELLRSRDQLLRALPITSPITGTVLHIDVGVGQVIESNDHLLEVVDLSRVWAQIRVLERDLHRVKVGQAVTVRLAGAPADDWVGKVEVKERYLDPQTHWGTVWAELPNPQGKLLPGLFGQARIRLQGTGEGLVLPASALVSAGAERFVFVEEGPGQYRRQNVVIQYQHEGAVQVSQNAGLYPGDRVLTAGSHELASFFVQGALRLSPEAEQNIGLRVEPARRQTVAEVLTVNGTVDLPPSGQAIVSARLAGMLDHIIVDRDQTVRAGDVVAEVFSLEFHALQLELLRSHLQAGLLERTRGRLLREAGSIPERLLRENQAALLAAKQRRNGLRSKLRAAGLTASQIQEIVEGKSFVQAMPVRAPIDGVVVRFRATLGQAVKAEAPLFEVHQLAGANLRVYVSERDLGRVRIGQRGRVRLTADPAFVGEAVIAQRGRALGAGHRALPVWAEFSTNRKASGGREPPVAAFNRGLTPPARLIAPRTPLLPGMMARLTLVVSEPAPTLAVPPDAVLREGLRAYLFVRNKDGTFERRPVETGRNDDRFVEITRGLAEGETIAVQGVAGLQNAYAAIQ